MVPVTLVVAQLQVRVMVALVPPGLILNEDDVDEPLIPPAASRLAVMPYQVTFWLRLVTIKLTCAWLPGVTHLAQ